MRDNTCLTVPPAFPIALLLYTCKEERCKGQIKVAWLHDQSQMRMCFSEDDDGQSSGFIQMHKPPVQEKSTCHAPSQVLSAEIVEAGRCLRGQAFGWQCGRS